jgi:carbonic anhydrase
LSAERTDPVDELLQRNARFADQAFTELPRLPGLRAVIVACVDARADPAHVLGLRPGEAAVVRTVGGRVTPAVLQNLALLRRVLAAAGGGDDLELVLMQHTDCGFGKLVGPEHEELVSEYLGAGDWEPAARSIADPRAGVREDLRLLAENPAVPSSLSVTGLVYDVASGRAELVERRSPLRES